MMESGHYHAAVTTDDVWICYPWEAKYVSPDDHITPDLMLIFLNRDIDAHDELAKQNPLIY